MLMELMIAELLINSSLIYEDISYTKHMINTYDVAELNPLANLFTSQNLWIPLYTIAIIGNIYLSLSLYQIHPLLATAYNICVCAAEIFLPYYLNVDNRSKIDYQVNAKAVLFKFLF